MRVTEILLYPFAAGWALLKLLFLPVLFTGIAWVALGVHSTAFWVLALLLGLWAGWAVKAWHLKHTANMRTMGRGSVRVSRKGGGH